MKLADSEYLKYLTLNYSVVHIPHKDIFSHMSDNMKFIHLFEKEKKVIEMTKNLKLHPKAITSYI